MLVQVTEQTAFTSNRHTTAAEGAVRSPLFLMPEKLSLTFSNEETEMNLGGTT